MFTYRTALRLLVIFPLLTDFGLAQSSALHWRLIGPFRGGRSVAVSGVVGSGTKFFFGGVDGGVWKTSNAGTTWSPIFDKEPVASIGALAVAPSDPNIIYVGTGESDIRSNLATGNGIYKSTDGGQTWTNIGLQDTRQISRIVIDPRNPDHILVAALGHAYAPNEERGVFLSTDGGAHWTKTLFKGPAIGAADIALCPDNPEVVFAALWEAHRPPWSTYAPLDGQGSGLYRSQDGGNSWTAITGGGFPTGKLGRIGVAVTTGTNGRRIYASVDTGSPDSSGIYRSDDQGASWKRLSSDPRLTSRAWYFSSITADPNNPDTLYIPNVALYKLADNGTKLTIVRGAPGGDDYHQLWIDPANSSRMALASDQGTVVSIDGGATWTSWYNQPTAQLYHVVTDNAYPYHVYGAQQDSGTAVMPSRTDHEVIDARDFSTVSGSESGYIAPDPTDPNVFYISGTFGTVERFDRRTRESQNIAPWPGPATLGDPSKRKYRDPWTPVLVFSRAQHNALYLGTQYVMRTLDGGLHWQTISPDLTIQKTDHAGYGIVYSIAPSPLAADQIWAGSDSGLVHLTRDAGKSWTNVTPPDITPWSKIAMIEASHFSPGEAYITVDRHRLDDMQPYAFRTRDYGKTWQAITNGIAPAHFLNVIREDPKRQGLLFAGTEFGVYVSFNDGENWQSLQHNLPVTSVRDMVIHENDLVIATHGRSFWIMDDVAPLRQMSNEPLSATTLFAPVPAVRTVSDGFQGTPLPLDEPQAENPARGAYIDYFLGVDNKGPVTLEILDSTGNLIRKYSSADEPDEPNTNVPISPRWLHAPPALSAEPGLHRFVWDLDLLRGSEGAAPDDDEESTSYAGPMVLPGHYTVRLTTSSGKQEKTVQVILDPRSAATPTDLAQQFAWAKRALTDLMAAHKIDEKASDAKKKQLAPIISELSAALTAFESSDRAPTSQAIMLYEQAAAQLKAFHLKQ